MTTNSDPFERHGIDHLSPSSLRLWRDNPSVWIGKYLLHAPDEAGPGAWRGLAVEAGVNRLLFGADKTDAEVAMLAMWETHAQGVVDQDALREYEALLDFLQQAWFAYVGTPTPLTRQTKVSLEVPGISVPLVGYADWVFPESGNDLKTTWRIPSQPDPSHIEQVTCYAMHTGKPFTLTYVSPKRWTRYEVSQQASAEAWDRIIETAHAVRSFLSHVDSAHDALSMFAPDYTSFYFRPPMIEAVKAAKAVRVLR
jgi:hypothetical protein